MSKGVGTIIGGIALIIIGLGMIEMAITDPEFGLASRIFAIVTGLIFVAPGVLLIKMTLPELQTSKKGKQKGLVGELSELILLQYGAEPDKNELEKSLSSFRFNYSKFLRNNYPIENAPINGNVTQVFSNILEIRRNRLRRMGITCDMKSTRMNYTKNEAVHSKRYFDGKYDITDVKEDIAAETTYLKDGRKIYSKTNKDIAYYTLINAKQNGPSLIVCPNCGSQQTREQLMDGCDYCGTRFILEDLGRKVSDFALRSDYDIQYEKYKNVRNKLNLWIGLIIGIVVFIWSAYWSIVTAINSDSTGLFMSLAMILFITSFVTASFVFMGLFCFDLFVFPFIQLGASLNYASKKTLNKLKNEYNENKKMEEYVKGFDPLFSISAFYSNIQNKLASIHFANNVEQINAFSMIDLSGMGEYYSNIIDMTTDYISLKDFQVANGLQIAHVEANLSLIRYNGNKAKKTNEKINLTLTKSAECKSQVVCGPTLLRCRACGAPITLLAGKLCRQCGTDIYLERFDWVIRDYKV